MQYPSTQALHFMYDYLVSVYSWEGSLSDVATILEFQNSYYERVSHTHTDPYAIIRYVKAQSLAEGLEYHEDQIEEVLEAEYAYTLEYIA